MGNGNYNQQANQWTGKKDASSQREKLIPLFK